MKKLILATAILASSFGANAQLKVEPNGSVGLNTVVPHTSYSATIDQQNYNYGAGSLLMRSPGYGHALRMGIYPANGHLGSSNGTMVMYYWGKGYNHLWAKSFNIGSDSTIKSNIESMDEGLDAIMKLRSVSYFYKDDVKAGNPKLTYGFIAQEVQKVLPNIASENMEILGLDYIQFIPLLVQSVQEQQQLIVDQKEELISLREEIESLKEMIVQIAEHTEYDFDNNDIKPAAVLYQNKPNPFKERTTIAYQLPETFSSASIMVFDMTGELLEQYPVSARDGGQLTIEGRQFKPGMYLYSLIVDDVEIDTKKMILNK